MDMVNLTTSKRLILLCVLGAVLTSDPHLVAAAEDRDGPDATYILHFRPTQNAPPGASGRMEITVGSGRGDTAVGFSVRHAYPNTLYTIWTVFAELKWPLPKKGIEVPTYPVSDRPGFPSEGNAVSPLARLDDRFTS